MKSLCIKTKGKDSIDYLLNCFSHVNLENIYFIHRKFKHYENFIIHYAGEDTSEFYSIVSNILTDSILLFFEPLLLRQLLNYNYFYFDHFEKTMIEKNCYDFIMEGTDDTLKYRKDEVYLPILKYIMENKCLVLEGFINFRLPEYSETLDYVVDFAVNKYIIDKEYTEFINLLRVYINSKEAKTDMIHLVFTNGESVLLDDNKNIIPCSDFSLNAKYLSDISFSSNDFALNTLLTLLPKKIEIHLIGYSCPSNEFIETLKLVFENRVVLCTDCNICRTYKVLNNVN